VQNNLQATVVKMGEAELRNIRLPMEICRIVLPWEKHAPAPVKSGSPEHPIKKAFPLVLALVVVALGGIGIWLYYFSGRLAKLETAPQTNAAPPVARALESKSVAVLPFVNMSADKDNEYLSDGITEDLCTALTQVRGLRVPARTSCFVFKGKADDIRKIGQQLNVATVLEGSVSQSGDKLRITAQLISVADGFHLWATNYDREMSDLLTLRSEIAQQVVAAMRVQLLPGEKQQLEKKGTDSPEAHRLYLLGLSFWNQRTEDSVNKALDYFGKALVKDPNYALAHVGLADCYIVRDDYGFPTKEASNKASAAALTALRLDDTLGEAHAVLASARWLNWDWTGAEAEFRRAIELTPNYATAHHWYSHLLRELGRFDEATREIQRAQELDPLSPIINVVVGRTLDFQGHYDQAIAIYRAGLELNPNFRWAHDLLGRAYMMKQMYSEAIMEFQTVRASAGNTPFGLGNLGYAYAISGRVNEAHKVLDELTGFLRRGYEVQKDIAFVYQGLGDRERSLDWLEKALEAHAQARWLPELKYDPLWQNLRSEPRFVALLKKMGLEK
jgi:TolB-like protein/Flp pilus assembly protein TadD